MTTIIRTTLCDAAPAGGKRAALYRRVFESAALCLAALLLAACGEPDAPAAAPGAGNTGALDACLLLANADPGTVLGEAVDEARKILQTKSDDLVASQCSISATDHPQRSVSLLVRHSAGIKAPASRQAYIAQARSEDAMGAGEDLAQALEAGRQIPGLGDLALTYELYGLDLIVWRGGYELVITLTGFAGQDAEQRAVTLAKAVLTQL